MYSILKRILRLFIEIRFQTLLLYVRIWRMFKYSSCEREKNFLFSMRILITIFGLLTDENYKRRHVDPYIRSAVPKIVFNNVRNPYRDLSHAGHYSCRRISPREYVATDTFKVVLVPLRENATIACFGESVNFVLSDITLLKYSPFLSITKRY